ncbi:ABC transporter permease [Puniceicoccaceae bacterium K14]|nr:ABC transporter permease [Puniceicoccaceae bacterium K14]
MPSITRTVFSKELSETLRDKRVLFGVMLFPLLVTPLLLLVSTFFMGKKAMNEQNSILPIGIYQEADFPELVTHFENDKRLKLKYFTEKEALEQSIENRETRAALIVSQEAAEKFKTQESASLEILFNQANEKSENARRRIRQALRAFDADQVNKRLESIELDKSFIQPTQIEERSIASKNSMGGYVLSIFLPYIIIMSASFGGMTTAFDLCAGEKERGTMETLLVSPASRIALVQGKLLTICFISILAAICALTGILIPFQSGLAVFNELVGDSISISYASIGGMLLIVVPVCLMTSSILLLVSSFARNPKEAQTYVFPFMMIVIFPAMLSTILGAESPLYTAFIPILNTALAIKQMLSASFQTSFFLITLATSILYAFGVARLATRFFQKESIIFRT